jgi:hypothetical protein
VIPGTELLQVPFWISRSFLVQCGPELVLLNYVFLMSYKQEGAERQWRASCKGKRRGRVSVDETLRIASEGEGACLRILVARYHLPLRRKLGWTTPRAGVKTTLASETRLRGLRIPSWSPNSFVLLPADQSQADNTVGQFTFRATAIPATPKA